jgi:hypothetical protein
MFFFLFHMQETFKQPDARMLSDASEIQFLGNLLQSQNAKKVLDIGMPL